MLSGEHDRSIVEGTEVEVTVDKIFVSPLWNAQKIDGDAALLKLSRDLDLTGTEKHLKPVCVPDVESIDKMAGQSCIATGWGNTAWRNNSNI